MLLAAGFSCAPAAAAVGGLGADPPVRVLLFETSSTLLWVDGATTAVAAGAGPVVLEARSSGTRELGSSARSARPYPGRIEVRPAAGGGLSVIATLPLEEYLRGVVPSEIGPGAPEQAACAQAVAARSFAVLALLSSNHPGAGYDVCSTVDCQAYSGLARATPATDTAVRATRGQVLTFEGHPIPAYYASNCGGHTEEARIPWPERAGQRVYHGTGHIDGPERLSFDLTRDGDLRKWLGASPDVYCNPEKYEVPGWAGRNFRWTREFTADDVTSFVARRRDIGRVTEIRPGPRGASGRLTEIEFAGENGAFRIGPELAIRRLFQPALKSAAFTVEPAGPSGRPDRFIFRGAGSGHGVGMCQTGAMGMANAGKSFREILRHYYPKARVEKLYD